jgi:hypothetical protein
MDKDFMRSIEDELAALTGDIQGGLTTVSDKINALAGLVPKDKNSFMNTAVDTVTHTINGMSTNTFNSSLGPDTPSVLPYDDLADLFLDSATGFSLPPKPGEGAKSSESIIKRSRLGNAGAGRQTQPVGLGMALVPEIAPIEGACGDGQGKPPEEIHVMTPTRGDEGGNNPLSRRGAAPFYRGGSGAGYARMGNKRTCWWSGWQAAGPGLGIIYPLKRWVAS